MDVVQMEPRALACIRVTGPYGQGYPPVMAKLTQWLTDKGVEPGRFVFIYLDNPMETPPEQCRTDVGVEMSMAVEGGGEVFIQPVPGGMYAESRHIVTDPKQYGELWGQHYGAIAQAGLTPGDGPSFELYHSVCNEPFRDDVSLCTYLSPSG